MMNNELIEYYGLSPNRYKYLESFEEIISLKDISILEIIRVYGNIGVIYKNAFEKNIISCILSLSLTLEYLDLNKDGSVNVIFKDFYVPFNFKGNGIFLSPKIKDLHVKLLSPSNIYVYASISPCE
ncbi:MAG: hypothetical protein ACRC2K_03030 [Clostridium sp.]